MSKNIQPRDAGRKNDRVWITFRIGGDKFYGMVREKDFTRIGTYSVPVFMPFMPVSDGDKNFYRLCLDLKESKMDSLYYNTTLWTCWQKMDESNHTELNNVVQSFADKAKAKK